MRQIWKPSASPMRQIWKPRVITSPCDLPSPAKGNNHRSQSAGHLPMQSPLPMRSPLHDLLHHPVRAPKYTIVLAVRHTAASTTPRHRPRRLVAPCNRACRSRLSCRRLAVRQWHGDRRHVVIVARTWSLRIRYHQVCQSLLLPVCCAKHSTLAWSGAQDMVIAARTW
jgi:hypothetical protein